MAGDWTLNRRAVRHLTRGRTGDVVRNMTPLVREVETYAVLYAPVDTGLLMSSIHTTGPEQGIRGPEWYVVANTSYAIFVHDGTRHMADQPFLVDAINAVF